MQDLWENMTGNPTPEWGESDIESASLAISAPIPDVARDMVLAEKLAAVFLYDCIDEPRIRPAGRSQALRVLAGEKLVAGMEQHLQHPAEEYTEWLGGFNSTLEELSEDAVRKCGQEKLAKLDPDGILARAIELSSEEEFTEIQDRKRAALMDSLSAATKGGDPAAVMKWRDECKAALYDDEEFCLPSLMGSLFKLEKMDLLVSSFFHYGSEWSPGAAGYEFLDRLAKSEGSKELVASLLSYVKEENPLFDKHEHDGYAALHIVDWLNDNEAFAGCRNKEILFKLLESDRNGPVKASCSVIGKHRCSDKKAVKKLIALLSHENGWVRRQAALALGELGARRALKHLGGIRFTDPFWDDGCSCFPVRDAAKKSYEALRPKKR